MAAFLSVDDVAFVDETSSNAMPLLDTNWQTTAAVGLSVASGGVAGAIMLTAFPAQTLITGAAIGGLAVTGKRRADGLSAIPDFPFLTRKDASTETVEPVATTDPVVATV